jgi:hypothetical protein
MTTTNQQQPSESYGDPIPGPPENSPQAKAQKTLEHELAITFAENVLRPAVSDTECISNLNKLWRVLDVDEELQGRSFMFRLESETGQVIEFRVTCKATGQYWLKRQKGGPDA